MWAVNRTSRSQTLLLNFLRPWLYHTASQQTHWFTGHKIRPCTQVAVRHVLFDCSMSAQRWGRVTHHTVTSGLQMVETSGYRWKLHGIAEPACVEKMKMKSGDTGKTRIELLSDFWCHKYVSDFDNMNRIKLDYEIHRSMYYILQS